MIGSVHRVEISTPVENFGTFKREEIVMAEHVAGDEYFSLDGQLSEIKRQLRQKKGYPNSLSALRNALQDIIHGVFLEVYPESTISAPSDEGHVVMRNINHYGSGIVTDAIIPVQLSDGSYHVARFENRHLRVLDLGKEASDVLMRARRMPLGKGGGHPNVEVHVDAPYHNRQFTRIKIYRDGEIKIEGYGKKLASAS